MGQKRCFYNGGEILPFSLETELEKLFFWPGKRSNEERELEVRAGRGSRGRAGMGEHHERSKVSKDMG